MSDFITHARTAATQEDWPTLVSILQRVLFNDPVATTGLTDTLEFLPFALQVLEAGDFQAQWEVAKVFSSFGKAAIAPLITLLQNETAELEARWFAARILGELNDAVAIRALVEQLQAAEDDDLNQVIAESLANLGSDAISALTELLAIEETRRFALQALAQIRQVDTIPPLLSLVHDPEPTIRAIAIEALGNFYDPRIPEILVPAIKDPSAQVRKAAISGLSARHEWVDQWNLIPLIIDCLWDLNLGVCQQAALALGKLRKDEAVPALQRALLAPNTLFPLQIDSLRALSWIGSKTALNSMQECLQPDAKLPIATQQELFALLGRWEDQSLHSDVVQILSETLNTTTDSTLRRTIATALGELKHPDGLDPLIQLLADTDPSVRLHAIAALQQVDPIAAYTRLARLQSSQELSESLRDGVIVALREWNAQLPR